MNNGDVVCCMPAVTILLLLNLGITAKIDFPVVGFELSCGMVEYVKVYIPPGDGMAP